MEGMTMKKLKSTLVSLFNFMAIIMMALLLPVWFLIGAVMQTLGKESVSFFGWDLSIKG